jgi:hypothetical protein
MKIISQKREIVKDNDLLLITGDGKTLPDDLEKFYGLEIEHDTMCIGRSILRIPGQVHHYAEVDVDAGKWVLENLDKNHPHACSPIRHTIGEVDWVDVCWEIENCPIPSEEIMWHGSTAYFGVLIGLHMGYDTIALAGVPLDSKGHWYFENETSGPRWTPETYQAWFEFAGTKDSLKVRSFSGYTKTILGPPTRSRLIGIEDHYERIWINDK